MQNILGLRGSIEGALSTVISEYNLVLRLREISYMYNLLNKVKDKHVLCLHQEDQVSTQVTGFTAVAHIF